MKMERKIKLLLSIEPCITSARIAENTGISIRKVYEVLSRLHKDEIVKYDRDANTGIMYWRLK